MDVAREFLGSCSQLKEFNTTFIVLIPKKPDANCFQYFRPISLCNSIYKILTKNLIFRLKKVLTLLILKNQNGFVQGRQIIDSIIAVHESIHSLLVNKRPSFLL